MTELVVLLQFNIIKAYIIYFKILITYTLLNKKGVTMKKIKTVCLSLSTLILLSACAPKQDDHLAVKTLKHASMTPVYVGAVANGVLMLTVGLPFAWAAGAFDKSNIKYAESKYKREDISKAFAVAVDSKEAYAFGVSSKRRDQTEATLIALNLCNIDKTSKNIKDECVLYYSGDEKMFELSTKFKADTFENNESVKKQNEKNSNLSKPSNMVL